MKNKKLIIGFVSVVVVATGVAAAWYFTQKNSSNDVSDTSQGDVPTSSAKSDIATGQQNNTSTTSPSSNESSDDPKTSTPSSDNQEQVQVRVTQANQDGDTVYIRALVDGATSGTCSLTLTHESLSISKSAPFGAQANYVICQGFNIPASEFTQKGDWKVSITATAASGSLATTTSSITIR